MSPHLGRTADNLPRRRNIELLNIYQASGGVTRLLRSLVTFHFSPFTFHSVASLALPLFCVRYPFPHPLFKNEHIALWDKLILFGQIETVVVELSDD